MGRTNGGGGGWGGGFLRENACSTAMLKNYFETSYVWY